MKKEKLFNVLKNGLIVSCQAKGKEPLNKPEVLALLAKSAILGGAVGIRTEGFLNTKTIRENVKVPVIGLIKSRFQDKTVRITGSFKDVEELIKAKCQIIAIDGTFRIREKLSGPDFISVVKNRFPEIIIMADISTFDEAIACINTGADCVSTTLSGYTPETLSDSKYPDLDLLKKLVEFSKVPIVAEGRYNTPELAQQAIQCGAWSVVVGTAITRTIIVTKWFADKINSKD